MLSIAELLSEHGPLQQTIDGFAPRRQQQEMAQAIAQALDVGDVLIAEAGTGTGKTVAYLIPALLSGKKIIISTGTKNLQDQLYFRDLPQVRNALGVPVSTALLKGRANYACLYRMDHKLKDGRYSAQQLEQLRAAEAWLQTTRSGDISECDSVPEDAPIWPQVTSTADNCLGAECPNVKECYVVKARQQAQQADILVINHHLFFADLALRDEGFGEILPGAEGFIFDEAHQLADVATQFFGISLSSRQLLDLARDALHEVLREAADEGGIQDKTDQVQKRVRDFRLLLGDTERRAPWQNIEHDERVMDALYDIRASLNGLERLLKPHVSRGAGVEKCWQRTRNQIARVEYFLSDAIGGPIDSDEALLPDANQYVRWYETRQRGFMLHMSPASIAQTFHDYITAHEAAWIFTSATLAVGDSFNYFASNLGIESAHTRRWDSPFDYQAQSLLYLPEGMPEPNARHYTRAVVDAAIPVINACEGRTFILVTSYRALNEVAGLLKPAIDYPLLVQGDQPRTELLNRFRALGNAVLVGTSSFWEGVDVKGSALSCVIIDKLPFASPDEPLLQARIQSMRERGMNPFFDYQIPEAVITLKQGIGRLIRDANDRGVLMLCDPRLRTKAYGKIFLKNLPRMTVTGDLSEVENFFSAMQAAATAI
ncbi:MAG: ATP-dependent DNA helicase [Gammaproteobacteria bacterium]|nr:ATP-dependent DNA helicase [Gammaproteobacteria bacterium]